VPSGGAFWVKSDGGTDAVLLTEGAKSGGGFNVFGRMSHQQEVFRVNLMNQDLDQLFDGVAVIFSPGGEVVVNQKDAEKFGISADNVSIFRSNTNLAIEIRPTLLITDTLFLRLHQLKAGQTYSFNFSAEQFANSNGFIAELEDLYLKTKTPISLSTETNVRFIVDNQALSQGDRFRVVFRSNNVTSVRNVNELSTVRLFPNPVSVASGIQLVLTNSLPGRYTVNVYSMLGVKVMSSVFQHNGGSMTQIIGSDRNMTAGLYIVEVVNEKGLRFKDKLTIQ
jgi:hypothetical protein